MNELDDLFDEANIGTERMFDLIRSPQVSQITANGHDRIFFVDDEGSKTVSGPMFSGPDMYIRFLDALLAVTDAGYTSVNGANCSVIEGSFRADLIDTHGSIHISTREITRGEPALTIRKQPRTLITLDDMAAQGMMSAEMRMFLQAAVHGRLNILISGGSGAGKTTLARALSQYIDPSNRVVTAEEIDELHLADRLHNVTALTTFRKRDDNGVLIRETTLEDLVREALRMRADRVWVGETRGREALALTKAVNSGHDGSVTTVHADNGPQAVRQLVTYVMESGLAEGPARDQVARGFHLVVQISKERMGRRVIREITELEPVIEGGTQQRYINLWDFDGATQQFRQDGRPSNRLVAALARYGVNYHEVPGLH